MKLSSSVILMLTLGVSSGFVPGTSNIKKLTSLNVATSRGQYGKWDDWSEKPVVPKKQSPTESVVSPNAKTGFFAKQRIDDVVVEPDFFFTWSLALLGPLIMWYHPSYAADGTPSLIGIFGGCFHILFAALLGVQTARVRMVFEKDGFEFYNIQGKNFDLEKGAKLVPKPSNYVAGTDNRWKYDKITNYGFFPSIDYPVICYFKETQTPEYKWNRWFAAFDSNGHGQPHFFPGICNVRKIKEQFELRGVKRKPINTFAKSDKNV